MKPIHHVIASAGVSLGLQATLHSWPATIGCFFSGVLIDIDHYLDYWLIRKQFPFRYKDLAAFSDDMENQKVYLIFHAYELLFIFWLLIYLFGLGKLWIGIAVGLTTHLLFDQCVNPIKPFFYFLTYRCSHQFEKSQVLSEKYFQKGGTA